MAGPNPLFLESPRTIDDSYQVDRENYDQRIRQLRHILAVRAEPRVKAALLSTEVRIINRGQAEAFSMQGAVYLDIALLDLLSQFADELSIAEIKNDPYHQLEFNLAYAEALDGSKRLALLDAFNTSAHTKEQWQYLWEGKQRAERVIFDNIVAFIIAHEVSHIVLGHERKVETAFPDKSDRHAGNVAWVQQRRAIELEADESGARICLSALVQPAMLIPWFDLNETRRRHYGKSADYPTTAQRITVVNKAYRDLVGTASLQGDLTEFNPLPPDRDVLQSDIHLFLEEFRKVRKFRQSLLVGLDQTVADLLKNGVTAVDAGRFFYDFIEQKRDLLKGARNASEVDSAIRLAEKGMRNESVDISDVITKLKRAGVGANAMRMFESQLESSPVDWPEVQSGLKILRAAPVQFAQGLDYAYLLGNTQMRWQSDVFRAMQSALPAAEVKARRLKPYVMGQPVRGPLPTYEQRLDMLRRWDGKYP